MVSDAEHQAALDRIVVLEHQVEDGEYREQVLRDQLEALDSKLCETVRTGQTDP